MVTKGFILWVILKDIIKFIITCPAVMFAAKRNLRVIGRTKILDDSINTKNGLSHIGELSGSK